MSRCREGSSLLRLVEDPAAQDWKQAVFYQQSRGYYSNWTDNYQELMETV